MKQLIYIAEDEKNIRETLRSFLENDGYEVCAFETGDALLSAFFKRRSDLVILDIMMPGTDGLTCCRLIRERDSVPIILLTAKDTEYDYVNGILQGGDDYLTKPFSVIELVSRVRAVLRRCQPQEDTGTLRCGDLTLDTAEHTVSVAGQRVDLTYKEYELLRLFHLINTYGQTILMVTHSVKAASHAGRVLFIKDGEVFHQLYRGDCNNEQFYQRISDALTMLQSGGDAQ